MRRKDLPLLITAGVIIYLLLRRGSLLGGGATYSTPYDSTTGLPITPETGGGGGGILSRPQPF